MDLQAREQALSLLKKFYGYSGFRPGQWEVISATLSGRDTVVLMPTGGGKSLCYQLPALMLPGCTLVVSPLIALMEDQTAALVANGIPAAAIHSNRSESENREIVEAAVRGRIRLLYISPERLLADFDSWVSRLPLSLFAIDEAHCISQWGHDFRPVYTRLSCIKERYASVPVMALTATADRLTRSDIDVQLRLKDPMRWVGSFNRPNISLNVVKGATGRERLSTIVGMLRRYPNDSGIVYCLSRKGAEDMAGRLSSMGYRVGVYHAGMTARERAAAQQLFSSGEVQAMCATVAFGMGIDKSNIRWVVHNNMPGNIESYYQEIGRAGRDGLPSEAVLFYSFQDVIMREKFLEESGIPLVAKEKLEWMKKYAEADICRRRMLLSYFGERMDHDCGNCDVCLDQPSRFDGTVLVQMAGSAILRTGSEVGIFTLTDILRGSGRAEIRRRGYDRIKTYGVGRELSAAHWNAYIGQMVQLGLFEVAYDDANHLKVTPYGMSAIRGEVRVELAQFTPVQEKQKKANGRRNRVAQDPTTQLFEQLKAVRRDIAAQAGITPEVVFNDAALLDMARKKPSDIDGFLTVQGVSERKAVKYGKKFIAAIRKFEGMPATQQGQTYKETLVLHNAGVPLKEIAEIKGVQPDTILGHIARLVDQDMIGQYAAYISAGDYKAIASALELDPENAYYQLKEKYAPALINLAKSIYNKQKRNGR